MYHVELRRFPHLARVFNLSEQELQERFVGPWIGGRAIVLDERTWATEKTRLTVYEGPEVAAEERGLGRGWSIVTRSGKDVTNKMLEAAGQSTPVAELKRRLLDAAPLALSDLVVVGNAGGRLSERLAVAEQALWELLHEERLRLVRDGAVLPREEWQSALLEWGNWIDRRITVEPRM